MCLLVFMNAFYANHALHEQGVIHALENLSRVILETPSSACECQ